LDQLEHRVLMAAVATRLPLAHTHHVEAAHHADDGFCGAPPAVSESNTGIAAYQINSRWSTTATNPSTGTSGDPITLTWGLVADGVAISGFNGEPTSGSILQQRLNALYGSQSTWLPLFQSVFNAWGAAIGVTYVYQAADDGAAFGSAPGLLNFRPDVRIGGHFIDGAGGVLAYNFYAASGGDMVIDTDDLTGGGFMTDLSNNSLRLRNVVAHEHGHGLGLAHVIPVDGTKLMEPFASTAFDGPQFDDILAGNALYGDVLEKGGRNETAATASNRGSLAIGSNTLGSMLSVANSSDVDYLKFTVTGDRRISFSLAPQGTTYQQGPQNGTATSFNAAAQADLALTIYGTDGTTVLSTANATGLGGSEAITNLDLPAGTYYARVTGTGNAQMYQLSATTAAVTRGDMNNDGAVNNLDIAPFVQGLTNPAGFRTTYGYAPDLVGDVNRDGAFNNLDIAPFVSLLTTSPVVASVTTVPSGRVTTAVLGESGGRLGLRSPTSVR
jgi:hypothetical protein